MIPNLKVEVLEPVLPKECLQKRISELSTTGGAHPKKIQKE
jgi:hypothetical protein